MGHQNKRDFLAQLVFIVNHPKNPMQTIDTLLKIFTRFTLIICYALAFL